MRERAALYLTHVRTVLGGSPIRVGYLLTGLWLVALAIYITFGKGWGDLWRSGFGEVGDFLSGAFAPLAFFWLVIAVFLQRTELGLQREELRQSREALEEQAKETRALVEQNRLSVEVANRTLQQQQLREREARLHQVIDALALRIINSATFSTIYMGNDWTQLFGNEEYLRELSQTGRDTVLSYALKRLVEFVPWVDRRRAEYPGVELSVNPVLAHSVQQLLDHFDNIYETLVNEPELETVKARAYALDLGAYNCALRDVLAILASAEPTT